MKIVRTSSHLRAIDCDAILRLRQRKYRWYARRWLVRSQQLWLRASRRLAHRRMKLGHEC